MRYFELPELVDRATYQKYGDAAWNLFHQDALEALDGIREFFAAPVTVNNWWDGKGSFQYRGYRPPDCHIGAPMSYHRRGMAFDLDVKGHDAEEVRAAIIENRDNPLLIPIQRLEAGVSWVHFDVGLIREGKSRIYLFEA